MSVKGRQREGGRKEGRKIWPQWEYKIIAVIQWRGR
jgi:hypothetical protein